MDYDRCILAGASDQSAAFGKIKQTDFGRKNVPVAELKTLSFDEPIWFLNLEASDVRRPGMLEIAEIMDAKLVN